ncbi:phytanoyl-CoA dioxygenase family protein [Paenibacillus cymbidii]|uniref:phytanoyl-CoA dioxygenase family protein n=1 Tax=Paenibacillus cymbidii TaxID=1639034 RepID=UPI0010800C21|nr:phytanoyl-CoA dioxygenase family protein [Paenibacillus cymbidii]
MSITFQDIEQYRRDGYLLVDDVFAPEEVEAMLNEVHGGKRLSESELNTSDTQGNKVKLAYWEQLIGDIWSAASTDARIALRVRLLLGEEASFFHGKVMLKEARTGGAWEWHQDYGYWYNQGFLYPGMISAFVALDAATVENGCLRVLKGSHKLGRLDHGNVGGQTGADPARMKELEGMYETVHVTMSPGSVLFFDANLLHCSAANASDRHRRSFIMCYSAWSNPQLTRNGIVRRDACPIVDRATILPGATARQPEADVRQ